MRAAPSILIIEDNDFALDVLSQLLPALGAGHVACARSAEVALEILRSQKFSAILADYRLGGMDGVQFIECLRAGGDQTPVLMISGTPDNAGPDDLRHPGQRSRHSRHQAPQSRILRETFSCRRINGRRGKTGCVLNGIEVGMKVSSTKLQAPGKPQAPSAKGGP